MLMQQNEFKKTPLIDSAGLLSGKEVKLLVSCCNVDGGLYVVAFSGSFFTYKKIIDGDCRGIARYRNGFILSSNTYGLLLLDNKLNIINQHKPDYLKDYHGVAADGEFVYVVETGFNTIGKYKLPDFDRINEFVLDPAPEDINHVNDIFVYNNKIYLSMFTQKNKWRDCPVDSGVVISADLEDFSKMEVLSTGLKHPHSVRLIDDSIIICNSSNFEVKENNTSIFRGNGYLRGIEKIGNTYYIGQSESRNVDWIRKENINISIDSGIHVFDAMDRISRFFPLPSPEVYSILDCSEIIDQQFFEGIDNIETPEKIDLMTWQFFVDTGDGFNKTLLSGYSSQENDIRIDLSDCSNIKALRFDPAITSCLLKVNSLTIKTEDGTESLLIYSHNGVVVDYNLYYFNHNNPQIIVSDVNPKAFVIKYSLYTDCTAIVNYFTSQLNQMRDQLSILHHLSKERVSIKEMILKYFK